MWREGQRFGLEVVESTSSPQRHGSSRIGGRYTPTGQRTHQAPVSRRSAQVVKRYWKRRARTKTGGSSGKGLWRRSLNVARSPVRSRAIRGTSQGSARGGERAANHISQSRRRW